MPNFYDDLDRASRLIHEQELQEIQQYQEEQRQRRRTEREYRSSQNNLKAYWQSGGNIPSSGREYNEELHREDALLQRLGVQGLMQDAQKVLNQSARPWNRWQMKRLRGKYATYTPGYYSGGDFENQGNWNEEQ